MADLDDFFAKKDKKKSKAKPKFLTAEELVKNLEDTSKREIPPPKPKKVETPVVDAVISDVSAATADEIKPKAVEQTQITDEEWKEFEEEQRKDYTGLKIGQLNINDEDDFTPTDGDDDENDSDSNINNESSKHSGNGPWKKVIPAEDVTQIPMEMEAKPKVYISPALRHSQQAGAMPGARVKPRNRTAPDITNADYFPSLGAARPEEQRKKKNEPAFEEVRHGGRVQRVQQEQTVARAAAATNRFQSLDEDDS